MVIKMEEKVRSIIQEVLALDDDVVNNLGLEQSLFDLGLDSIKAIEIVVFIEDIFNVTVDDEDLLLNNMRSVKEICDLIIKYVMNK